MNNMNQCLFVGLYLVAIVIANITTAIWGAGVSIANAFLLIGLDLTSRDFLHEFWKVGKWWRLSLLIGAGSIISWLLNRNAGQVAIASFVAFSSAAIVDTLIYHTLRKKNYLVKINGSNAPSALIDSVVFPTIAFGGLMPWVTLGQFVAKVGGGFLWSLVLRKLNVVVIASEKQKV